MGCEKSKRKQGHAIPASARGNNRSFTKSANVQSKSKAMLNSILICTDYRMHIDQAILIEWIEPSPALQTLCNILAYALEYCPALSNYVQDTSIKLLCIATSCLHSSKECSLVCATSSQKGITATSNTTTRASVKFVRLQLNFLVRATCATHALQGVFGAGCA